jgi:hypothetical protein
MEAGMMDESMNDGWKHEDGWMMDGSMNDGWKHE